MTRRPALPLLAVACLLPALVAAIGTGIALSWLPALPSEIVTHWGPEGPDGFAPGWTVVAGIALAGLLVPLLIGIVVTVGEGPRPTATHKVLAVTSLAVVTLLTVIGVWSLGIQRLPAGGTPDIGPGVLVGLGAALLFGGLGWFLLGPAVRAVHSAETAAPLPLAPGERAVWVATARMRPGAIVAILLGILLAAGAATAGVAAGGPAFVPIYLVPLVLVLALFGTAVWHLRIDDAGLVVRAALGWPVIRVTAGEVESAAVTRVAPLGEFGGWGPRWSMDGRFGIVLRAGEALEVRRHSGRVLVVTVDDAAAAASLVAAVAARAAAR